MYDVGIIGAGVHGAAAAYHLSAMRARVAVFERGTPASGPTGASSGICRAYYTNDFLAGVARDSIAALADFPNFAEGQESGFRRTGFLFMHPPEDVVVVTETVGRLRAADIRVEQLSADAVKAEFPAFDVAGIGTAVYEVDAGYADPAMTTSGLLAAAVQRGADVFPMTAVTSIAARAGGGWSIRAEDGAAYELERLLIAAGPWTKGLAAQLGVDLPLTVERHVVAVGAWGAAPPIRIGHADLRRGYYCKPEGESLFCLGWLLPGERVDVDSFDRTIRWTEQVELLSVAAQRVPLLAESEPRNGWASLYDVSPDWQPVIGEIAQGVFIDAGTSGHGFKLAPILGRYVAQMVLGSPDSALDQFRPDRFDAHRLLAAGYGAAQILG